MAFWNGFIIGFICGGLLFCSFVAMVFKLYANDNEPDELTMNNHNGKDEDNEST